MTGERGIIIERNLLLKPCLKSQQIVEGQLYGDDIYGVTVIINNNENMYKKFQLMYLMNQLKPVRCTLKLVYLDKGAILDGYTYMDINAAIGCEEKLSALDFGARVGQRL